MQNFLLSVNAVGPILLLVLLGTFLRKKGAIDEEFVKKANKLAYGYSLPLALFKDSYTASSEAQINVKLMVYAVASIVALSVILSLSAPRFIKDRRRCGAFVQGSFRSNFAILGSTMAVHVFGSEGALPTLMLVPVVVTTFTVCSIVVFTVFSPDGDAKVRPLELVKKVVTNPLIWGNVLGLLFRAWQVPVPDVLMSGIKYVAALATPLALISIGGQAGMGGGKFLSPSLAVCCALKLVIIPVAVVVPALFMGFAGNEIGAIFLAHCAPTGVTAYAMSMGMNSDYEFTGKVITVSTVLSFGTIFLGIFLLSSLGVF